MKPTLDTPNDEAIATILMGAWSEYVALYGRPPHGTFRQLHSMLALQSAGAKIAALFTPSEKVRSMDIKFCPGCEKEWKE